MPPEEVIDTPVTLPESTTFDEYVAQRLESAQREDFAAVVDPVVDADPNSGQTPEPTEPAPVTETPTAVATEPVAPEPAAEPVTVEETQEQKDKKSGIPQSRLDEVTKARREAERERDAAKVENERLARELAEAKAKPPEAPKPEPVVSEKPKPVAPEPPTLESVENDWEKFQAATKEYYKVTYPAYTEELTEWKQEQREVASQKKAADEAAAKRKQADDAAKKTADDAELEATKSWDSQIQALKDAHPDFETKLGKVPANTAMGRAIQDMDDGPQVAYWLTEHPEEAKRIFEATGSDTSKLVDPQFRKAVIKAAREFAKIDFESSTPESPTPVTEPVTPAPRMR